MNERGSLLATRPLEEPGFFEQGLGGCPRPQLGHWLDPEAGWESFLATHPSKLLGKEVGLVLRARQTSCPVKIRVCVQSAFSLGSRGARPKGKPQFSPVKSLHPTHILFRTTPNPPPLLTWSPRGCRGWSISGCPGFFHLSEPLFVISLKSVFRRAFQTKSISKAGLMSHARERGGSQEQGKQGGREEAEIEAKG